MIDLTGLKVMVIDDSGTILRAAEIYLNGPKDKPTGIIIKTVENGFDGINDIFEFDPDIIFLDRMMTKVEGIPLCNAIKRNPRLRDKKVIMLTSKDGLFDRAEAFAAGADDYIVKPFNRDTILKALAKHAPAHFQARGENEADTTDTTDTKAE